MHFSFNIAVDGAAVGVKWAGHLRSLYYSGIAKQVFTVGFPRLGLEFGGGGNVYPNLQRC